MRCQLQGVVRTCLPSERSSWENSLYRLSILSAGDLRIAPSSVTQKLIRSESLRQFFRSTRMLPGLRSCRDGNESGQDVTTRTAFSWNFSRLWTLRLVIARWRGSSDTIPVGDPKCWEGCFSGSLNSLSFLIWLNVFIWMTGRDKDSARVPFRHEVSTSRELKAPSQQAKPTGKQPRGSTVPRSRLRYFSIHVTENSNINREFRH